MHALPAHLHHVARCPYGCEQFPDRDSRCDECAKQLDRQPTTVTGRAGLIARIGRRLFARTYHTHAVIAQPTRRRTQPRDGRGRFLSKAWLAEAELFTAADRAWFRHPVNGER